MRLIAVDPAAGMLRELAQAKISDEASAVSWFGDFVLTGSWGVENLVQRWSIDTQDGLIGAEQDLFAHPSGLDVLAWRHDGQSLVTGGHDDTIRVWARRDSALEELASLDDHTTGVHAVSWSTDGAYLVLTSSRGDHVTLLDMRGCAPETL